MSGITLEPEQPTQRETPQDGAQQPEDVEDVAYACQRCGVTLDDGEEDVCECCAESIDEAGRGESPTLGAPGEDWEVEHSSDEPQDEPVLNDGFTVIRGAPSGGRRTWAAKEPYLHGTKKPVLHTDARKFLDLEAEEDNAMDDDDTPDLLGYLDQWPKLTGITKISMLRAAANYLSSQQRAAKPFQAPVKPPKRISAKMTAKTPKKRTRFDGFKK